MRYPVSLIVVALAFFLLPACASRAVAGKDTPDLTVFFTSDTRGMLRRCGCSEGQMGGVSARASYIKQNMNPGRTLVLDGGDTFFDGLDVDGVKRDFYLLKAVTITDAIKATGCDAINAGDFDLALGPEFLEKAVEGRGLSFLSANLSVRQEDDNFVNPFPGRIVRDLDGVRAGIAGVVDDRFPYGSFPDAFGKVAVSSQTDAAAREIKKLAEYSDIVILLAHESIEPVEELAKRLPGADIILQGHTNEHMETPIVAGGTIVLKGYTMGKYVGRLDLWLNKSGIASGAPSKKISRYEYNVIPLDESIVPDMEVEGIISGFRSKLKEKALAPGGSYLPGSPEGYAGPDVCRGCHPAQYENWSKTGHFRAYSTLVLTSDQYDPECLSCHTTGYSYSAADAGGKVAYRHDGIRDVTCEACHGKGGGHVASHDGGVKGNTDGGMVRTVDEDTCLRCHDEANSPYFSYLEFLEKGGAHRPASPVTGR